MNKMPKAFYNVACDGPKGGGAIAHHNKMPKAFYNVACGITAKVRIEGQKKADKTVGMV
ncbi:hypothetical protein LHL03_12350 [Pectobacterium carotovorum]|uniref:hypothetical protein n=1 Tax=Pectobacterium carotovorum TaxID=554 RepID=UPI001CF9B83B|nr:hypothetical protein [Pectobacterium carotovorum]UCZ77869.1 hypothetical protein LHL03_12350 [Pectobacterium carotovorum]